MNRPGPWHAFFGGVWKLIAMDKRNKKDLQHPPNKGNSDARQPDPETLGTTDPEEHMKGPISSVMQKIRKGVEKNDDKATPDVPPKDEE